jgi:hypothetical protein
VAGLADHPHRGLRIWPIKITGLKVERDQWRSAEHDWRRAA